MKTEQLLSLGLTEEQAKNVLAINGNDIEYHKKQSEQFKSALQEKESTITELTEKVSGLDGASKEVEDLKKQIEAYKQAEKDRTEAEKKAAADRELNEQITALVGDNEFVSDYAKAGFVAALKEKRNADKVSGLKDIFESLTKDQTGIFKNKQQEKIKLPNSGNPDENPPEWKSFF